ncbi:hypothetical protein OF83DRAFT_149005 [Amylostereum chailletii]|nr:hypothetical protein OF83DRAFT_149005 [Amylostereum chailletii]
MAGEVAQACTRIKAREVKPMPQFAFSSSRCWLPRVLRPKSSSLIFFFTNSPRLTFYLSNLPPLFNDPTLSFAQCVLLSSTWSLSPRSPRALRLRWLKTPTTRHLCCPCSLGH